MKEPHKILGIDKNSGEKSINSAFKKLALKYHPDTSQGETSKKFQEIKKARDEMIKKNKALVKTSKKSSAKQLSPIIREILKTQQKDFETKKKEFVVSEKVRLKEKYKLPKVSSATILAILTFLFFLPDTILSSPFYGNFLGSFINGLQFMVLWFLALYITATIWLMAWMRERSHLRRINELTSRSSLEDILSEIRKKFKSKKFSKSNFIEKCLSSEESSSTSVNFIFGRVSSGEEIAELILGEFLRKGLIEIVPIKDLNDWYKLA